MLFDFQYNGPGYGKSGTGTPVVEDYVEKMPFEFTGTLKNVVIELGKSGLAAADQKKLDDATRAVAAQE